MIDNLSKKIIFFLLLLFFVGNNTALALVVTATENVTISATVGSSAVVPPGNSITGGMGIPKTSVRFSGEAYPNSIVTILENGVIRTSTQANSLGYFEVTLEEKYNNNVLYTLFANDTSGNRSLLLNYPIVIYNGYLTYISGIRFAPTISTDKLEVRLEDYLTVSGSALPNADMGVTIGGNTTQVFTLTSNKDGSYKIILPLSNMSKGDYSVYANYTNDSR